MFGWDLIQDDFAPAGWKIVEAAKENTVVDDGKKAGSKLLSFFGRKSSQSDAILRSTPLSYHLLNRRTYTWLSLTWLL
jgi:hypothetical protein